jgi:methionyl aminopeptidase
MIVLKDKAELELMREAGKIAAAALVETGERIKDGVTTADLDKFIRHFIEKHGATPSFLNYQGFPASACISVNDEVIHGIPSKDRIVREGDIVTIDVGAFKKGYHSDTAYTFYCGEVSEEAKRLCEVTKTARDRGIEAALIGNRIGDIGSAVECEALAHGYSVLRDYTGHGVGSHLHEPPDVPNYGRAGHGVRLCEGMTIAIEPMLTQGSERVYTLPNEWTVVTADHMLSAHFEHTVAITPNGAEILTKV